MTDPLDLHSPAAAFARQAKTEAQVEAALLTAMRGFLSDVEALARRDGTFMNAGDVDALWRSHTSAKVLTGYGLDHHVALYVAEVQSTSSTPDEAYDTAMAVLTAANERVWSAELTRDVLSTALSMDTPPVALTAAAPDPNSVRGRALREAMDAALGGGGMSWSDVAIRDARTAVTGLDGMLTGERLRSTGAKTKRWVTRHDKFVRDDHIRADGQTVPVDEPFTVGGYPMMHPGDRKAPFHLTVNCRCVMVNGEQKSEAFQARAHAEGVASFARKTEPRISRDMRDLAARHGTGLEGFEFRLKSEKRIADKILRDVRDKGISYRQAADEVADSVRFTMVMGEHEYAAKTNAVLTDLRSDGYSARVKNIWLQSGRAYQGVNVALTSPDGQLIELQFHTGHSLAVKEPMHALYEEQQNTTKPGTAEFKRLEAKMWAMTADVPIPPDIETIRDSAR